MTNNQQPKNLKNENSEPPQLDRRSYAEIVQQTQALAESYTSWIVPNQTDVGLAAIRIFGRMAHLVKERLNQVPERNRLAFMNLVGTSLTPPKPARVPITFQRTAGSPVDVLVPTHTQIAAPPPEGEETEVIFETEGELLVTATQVQAMFVLEDRDYYSDRSSNIPPDTTEPPFSILQAVRPIEHYLYLHEAQIFDLPNLTTATFTITTDSTASASQLSDRCLAWETWDGKQWQRLTHVTLTTEGEQILVTLSQLPKLKAVEVNSQKAKWLRVTLSPHHRLNLPEVTDIQGSASVDQPQTPQTCFFNNIALDLSKDFSPFGTEPQYNDTFQIALDAPLIQPGVAIEINVHLSHAPQATPDLELQWEVGHGTDWTEITTTDNPEQFHWLRDNTAPKFISGSTQGTFRFPATLPPPNPETGEPAYWLRARIVQGRYGRQGRMRHYVTYNDLTVVATSIAAAQTEISVDSVEELSVGDTLRLQQGFDPNQLEDVQIAAIDPSTNRVTLNRPTRNTYSQGSRVLGKLAIANPTPDIIDPPLLQGITLTYKFFLEQPAHALAYNDFAFVENQPWEALLNRPASAGERVVQLRSIEGLVMGELIRFTTATPLLYQIEVIDPERQQIVLTEPLTVDCPLGTKALRAFHPLTPQLYRDSAFYLGFNQRFPNRPNSLYWQVHPPEPEEVAPGSDSRSRDRDRLVWEYLSPQGWRSLSLRDETAALTEKGLIQFLGPTDWIASPHCGISSYWLRVRQQPHAWEHIPLVLFYLFQWALDNQQFRFHGLIRYFFAGIRSRACRSVTPRLGNVRTNTTWARQSVTLTHENLGSSTMQPGQVFKISQMPILAGQQLEVEEGRLPSESEQQYLRQHLGADAIAPVEDETGELEAVWVRWQEVPDFYSSAGGDRHYILDRQQGRIQFGDGQAGMIPPRGRNNIRLSYRTGGGQQGNQNAQTIVELKTTIPYLDSAINWEAATGGNDQESLERLKVRSPKRLRHRDRAVTIQDFADLAQVAAVEVARVQALSPDMMFPRFNPLLQELWVEPEQGRSILDSQVPGNEIDVFDQDIRAGWVQLIIVPQSQDPRPVPTLALLNRVEQFIQARCVATLDLRVSGPKWQPIGISAEIVPLEITQAGTIKNRVEQALDAFLHPLTGGRQKTGWAFGRSPQRSDVYAALESVPGVSYVRALTIHPVAIAIDRQTLIYSGEHRITLKLPDS
ncbi:baseplate J/gp47 family protein [Spirulina sp. CS-785/01]|uniref:baseplate J/gp47 family protein n=1 Tax=Spirulina sp. CS-785/01 TaxID=3021716 RepID=UPI002330E6AE|nr:baseplate J/gp47 family protein [Spirulina sp. CS-785/01]MDB9315284.1 baseplate J/gp47 family protein [Spirulina sp. CS-785/01]